MKHPLLFALLLAVAAFSYTGCSQISEQIQDIFAPTIDATSANTFIDSMQKVRNELSQSDREKFDAAIAYFSIEYVKNNPGKTIRYVGEYTAFNFAFLILLVGIMLLIYLIF